MNPHQSFTDQEDDVLLHIAIKQADVAMLQNLLTHGCLPDHSRKFTFHTITQLSKWSPLCAAIEGMNTEIVLILLQAGADPNRIVSRPTQVLARSDHNAG